MYIFMTMLIFIRTCDSIFINDLTLWEIHQHLNSLGVPAEGAADPGELPFLAVVLDERIVICNGVIITSNLILTSSLCMKPEIYILKHENVTKITVMAGVYDTSVDSNTIVWRRAKQLMPDTNSSSTLLAIMLSESLHMTWQVSGIELPLKPFSMVSQHCFTAGFVFLNPMVPVYQYKSNAFIYNTENCSISFPSTTLQDQENLLVCAKVNYSKVDCRTDDSRILFCNKTLVGFVKEILGKNCSSGNTLATFVDAGRRLDFFEQLTAFEGNTIFLAERAFHSHSVRRKSSKRFSLFCNLLLVVLVICFLEID